jgi:hypothetical protein
MTIFLYCEGETDHAVLEPFIKKIGNPSVLEIKKIKKQDLKNIILRRNTGPYKLINALAFFARQEGCKNIAYHQDADRHIDERYNSIRAVFKPIEKSGVKCLAIVPKEAIESWLLADENTYLEIPKEPALPGKPEERWGDSHDPRSDHPKCYFSRVLEQFPLENNRDTCARIAENSDVETLKRRCPVSFGQFCADMQTFIAAGAVI